MASAHGRPRPQKDSIMRKTILLTGSALALGMTLALSSPAQAQAVCDLADGAATENTGGSTATGTGSLACGTNSSATGDTAIAIGNGAAAGPLAGGATLDHDGVAIGDKAKSTGFHSTAIGGEAVASGGGSQAFGWKANATGTQAAAVGNQAQATGVASTALGNLANASGDNSTALGNGALASGINSTAVGKGASTAGFANSVALGAGTVNTAANQVNVGGRTIGGVANGVLATDAVNMSQLNAALGGIAALQGSVAGLISDNRVQDRNIDKANEGVAMALALDSPQVPAGAHFAISGGIGGYQKQHALASAISAAINEMTTVSAGFGYGLDSGEVGYRAGFQFAF
jgi:hypothetical protein